MSDKPIENKKILLIYNPNAGSGMFARHLDNIIDAFQERGLAIIPVRGTMSCVLDYLLQGINQEQYRQIIIAGGDGTINTVVNLMMKYDIDLPITIFPAGTANDFAHYLGMPNDLEGMIEVALDDHIIETDIAKVNEKYFINVAAMGELVGVSQKTDPNLKNTIGVMAYYLKGLTEVTHLHPIKVRLTSKEYTGEEDMYFMVVMNGSSAGGFKKISPDADASDGLLDVLLFRKMALHEMAPLFFNVLYGSHTENKNVLYFQTGELYIEADEDVSTDVDGEEGEKFPMKFTVLHKKLKVFAPEGRR
ncbi:MAG: YegS/Rv2252/BmrU family lipid kinase [Eubacteriales bacterium]|nr:YegS/Rv2252/BmrU family lipid kinase [Eubacteriales bacterium]MDD4389535.1 YegS/Rv2252/BmrU family lipid kinase [Eubacteriales bacterium]